ncbi:uncharacterized protein LOC123550352 [Mercenaria mercenaria]|uniref:uncharacterized protein LOC123550352 n=1 Tax=Mercenaria mercenaria TaxID=6596 RepID=UPI001E1DE6C5|nr:uncharacterized protein LOC123550352 [Mercenaria mercenaria]
MNRLVINVLLCWIIFFRNMEKTDSRSDCGISMYLNKSRCYKCVYICGRIKNTVSQFCLNTCPNFDRHLDMPKDCHCDMLDCENSCTDPLLFQLLIVLFTVILLVLGVPLSLMMFKHFEPYKAHSGENENASKQNQGRMTQNTIPIQRIKKRYKSETTVAKCKP